MFVPAHILTLAFNAKAAPTKVEFTALVGLPGHRPRQPVSLTLRGRLRHWLPLPR
jgi:hypothetical protein